MHRLPPSQHRKCLTEFLPPLGEAHIYVESLEDVRGAGRYTHVVGGVDLVHAFVVNVLSMVEEIAAWNLDILPVLSLVAENNDAGAAAGNHGALASTGSTCVRVVL